MTILRAPRALMGAGGLILVLITGGLSAAGAPDGSTRADIVSRYVGDFAGRSVVDPTGILTPRDLDVQVQRTRHGFVVDWRSAVVEHGAPERMNHEVRFERTHTPGVYRAHRAPGVSGNARTPDPIDGRPYFWARVTDDALVVYVLHIAADGSLDMRIYERHVAGNRMRLEFTRLRDGQPLETASGELSKRGV